MKFNSKADYSQGQRQTKNVRKHEMQAGAQQVNRVTGPPRPAEQVVCRACEWHFLRRGRAQSLQLHSVTLSVPTGEDLACWGVLLCKRDETVSIKIKTKNRGCNRGMSLEGLRAGQMYPHITRNCGSKEWQPDYSPASAFNAHRDHVTLKHQPGKQDSGGSLCLCGSEGFH